MWPVQRACSSFGGATVAVVFVTASLLLAAASPARAIGGTYNVYFCHYPGVSTAAPLGRDWTPSQMEGGVSDFCDKSSAFAAAFLNSGTLTAYARTGWRFAAPLGTFVDGYTVMRAVKVDRPGGTAYSLYEEVNSPGDPRIAPLLYAAERCSTHTACDHLGVVSNGHDPANRFERRPVPNTYIRAIDLRLGCDPDSVLTTTCVSADGTGYIYLFGARVALRDESHPVLTRSPTGDLIDGNAPVEGVRTVNFAATDVGGGIRSVGLVIDGVERISEPVNAGDAACIPPYLQPVPCPPRVDTTFAFDTSKVPNGVHQAQISVTDAARNRTLSDSKLVDVRNGSQPNGRNASRFARLTAWFGRHKASTTVRFHGRPRIRGKIVNGSNRPIVGATLDVATRVARRGSRFRRVAAVLTNRRGRFSYLPRWGASRLVRIGYRAFSLDDDQAATTDLTLRVHAGVRLSATRHVRGGRVARFRGRLVGGPGRRGVLVTIYALTSRRPIPVESVRTNRRGKFSLRYRFRATTMYRFRAVARSQKGYPYATGRSRTARVLVTP